MTIISDWNIRHDEVVYPAGTVITDIDAESAQKLISDGIARAVQYIESAEPSDDMDPLMTVDEFSKLKADEQRAILIGLEIEPGSNEELRTQQYAEWYELQVNPDEEPQGSDSE